MELDDLQQRLKIPGMSFAIVKNQELIWAKRFGFANLENKIRATKDTPYDIALVTKTFSIHLKSFF